MKVKLLILSMAILLTLASSTDAFDGNRKGFSIGLGIGYSPFVKTELRSADYTNTYDVLIFDISIGWNFGNKNLITNEACFVGGYDDRSEYINGKKIPTMNSYSGFNWTHYYKETHPSWFTKIGFGDLGFSTRYDDKRYALYLGGGYEFIKQIQIEFFYTLPLESGAQYEFRNRFFGFTITGIAY